MRQHTVRTVTPALYNRPVLQTELEAHYQWTAAGDPEHVAWSVLYEASALRQYMRTFDVIGTDPYPINAPYDPTSTDGQAAQAAGHVYEIRNYGIRNTEPEIRKYGNTEIRKYGVHAG